MPKACLLLLVNLLSIQSLVAQVRFSMPLKGVAGKDFFIIHYADHRRQDSGLKDAFCGQKTYDGHKGTDMALSGFQSMDTGVYIYAVADGWVVETEDGNYDRNKKLIKGARWNYVAIQHGDIDAYYGHMARGSVMVKIGDSVREGQPIGRVGSSGYSNFPHLHFEVWNSKRQLIDPFHGSCSDRSFSYWKEQPAYDTSVFAIESGFVPYIPQLDTLREGYLLIDTFHIRKDTVVCFWAHLHGLREGSKLHVQWYNPRQKLHFGYTWRCKSANWLGYAWPAIKMPAIKGKWRAELFVNDVLVASRYFYVIK